MSVTAAGPDVRLETAIEALTPRLEAEWRRLCAGTDAAPFLQPFWFRAWADAFCKDELRVATARRGGALAGALPLVVGRGVTRAAANWHTPRYGAAADGPEVAAAFADALVSTARRRVDLTMLAAEGDLAAELRRAGAASARGVIARVVVRQPYVDLGGGWEAVAAALPRKLRKEARRLRRRAAEQGPVELVVQTGERELEPFLATGFALEGSGWKDRRRTAINSCAPTRRFYTQVARGAAELGMLRLMFLRIGDRPVAFDMCLESGGRLYALKGGFDPAYRSLGPGTVLAWESLRWAAERGLTRYEFLGDADPYKLAWTSTTHDCVRVQVFGRALAGRVDQLAWGRGRRVAKRLLRRRGR